MQTTTNGITLPTDLDTLQAHLHPSSLLTCSRSPLPPPCLSPLSSSSPLECAPAHVTSWILDISSSSGSRRLLYVTVMPCAQEGSVNEVPGGGGRDFDFDVLCSARCEPYWQGWLRSEVAVAESMGYPTGWVTRTCVSAVQARMCSR
jgi:hypothetical protein